MSTPESFTLTGGSPGTTDQTWWDRYYTAEFPAGVQIDVTYASNPMSTDYGLYLRPVDGGSAVTDEQAHALARHFRVPAERVRCLGLGRRQSRDDELDVGQP